MYRKVCSSSADRRDGLEPGDVVTIKLSEEDIPYNCINLYGGLPTRTEMEYTVGQMDRLITEVKDIPVDLDANMKSQLKDFVTSTYANDQEKSLKNYEVLGYYILTPKSGEMKNQVYLVYKASIHTENKKGAEDVTAYKYILFRNAIAYKDGTGYVDLLKYAYPTGSWLGNGQCFTTSLNEYTGFQNLNLLYNQCVASQLEGWTVDTNITMQ